MFSNISQKTTRITKTGIAGLVVYARRLGWWKVAAIAGVLVVGGLIIHAVTGSDVPEEPQISVREVQVRSVAELASETTPLSIVGTVSSKSEATVRAKSSGAVTRVYRALGDTVGAGAVVATLESAAQRAALLQAEGSEDAAQASLDKIKSGSRAEDAATFEASLRAARAGVVNALLSAYTAVDNGVPGTADTFFTNPASAAPRLNPLVSDSRLRIGVESQRRALGSVLERQKARAASLSASDDLFAEVAETTSEVRAVRDFLDGVITLLNDAIPTDDYPQATISSYVTSASTARTAINTALSTLSSAKLSLEKAENDLEEDVAGARSEDVAAAEAALKQAEGAVAAAEANLENTIIRAPISGTINSFSLQRGDYVTVGTQVLTVANNAALEVLAYVTEADRGEITVGQRVAFDTGATGAVTRVAPALDPVTKRIEVRIGVTDPDGTLVNGQSVLVDIERVAPTLADDARIVIPISAIKVEADRTTAFTVAADSMLVAHEVVLGRLLGERVEVVAGLSGDMEIVVDARGLREGQRVEVE